MDRLPLGTQTLYAELMEQLTILEAHRSIGHLPGCFTTKKLSGDHYYYFQYSLPGGALRQVYIGKKTPRLESIVERFLGEREEFKADIENIQRLCAQLRIGGALVTDAATARTLKALAESGVFSQNGVLIGTNAFIVLGNLLGVSWRGASARTQDIDISRESGTAIALPDLQTNIPKALEQLEMGFLPVPPLNHKQPSTSFKVRGKPLRVDVLTALKGENKGPVFIPAFNVAAQPLKYMDYLLERPEWGAVINGGGVLVKVPLPARFAFHKLIVSRSRELSAQDKSAKDVFQAAQVISVLADDRPGDLILGWEEIKPYGKNCIKLLIAGIKAMKVAHDEEYTKLLDTVADLRQHV